MILKSFGEIIKMNPSQRYSGGALYKACINKGSRYFAMVGCNFTPHVFLLSEDGKSEYIPFNKLLSVCHVVANNHNIANYNNNNISKLYWDETDHFQESVCI